MPNPREVHEQVELLVAEAEEMGLGKFVYEHSSKGKLYFDEDLLAHHLPCSGRKARRVKKLLTKRHNPEEYADA